MVCIRFYSGWRALICYTFYRSGTPSPPPLPPAAAVFRCLFISHHPIHWTTSQSVVYNPFKRTIFFSTRLEGHCRGDLREEEEDEHFSVQMLNFCITQQSITAAHVKKANSSDTADDDDSAAAPVSRYLRARGRAEINVPHFCEFLQPHLGGSFTPRRVYICRVLCKILVTIYL